MQQTTQGPTTTRQHGKSGGGLFDRRGSSRLNTGLIHMAPWQSMFLGGLGVLAGLFSNGWQVWTTQNALLIELLTNDLYLASLKKDPAHAAGLIPGFNWSAWVLGIFIQLGVLFFTLRIAHEFKEQLGHAQVQSSLGKQVRAASKATAVQVAHNRDLLFYYGVCCFLADSLGDYKYVFSFTDDITFLVIYAVVLSATSTFIFAISGEFLWAGYVAFRHAKAQWEATYANAARSGGHSTRGER